MTHKWQCKCCGAESNEIPLPVNLSINIWYGGKTVELTLDELLSNIARNHPEKYMSFVDKSMLIEYT